MIVKNCSSEAMWEQINISIRNLLKLAPLYDNSATFDWSDCQLSTLPILPLEFYTYFKPIGGIYNIVFNNGFFYETYFLKWYFKKKKFPKYIKHQIEYVSFSF